MAKRRKPVRRGKPPATTARAADAAAGVRAPSTDSRNAFLDSLRGLAIVLMVIDHVTGIWLDIPIQDSNVRLATRLSMPLFCLLMGYFLDPAKRGWASRPFRWQPDRWKRLAQIAVACVLANAVFWPHYGMIEILGSLLVAYLVFLASGRWFPIFVLAILFYPVDPLRGWFDFPVSLVISFVAQGMLVRRGGPWLGIVSGVLLSAAGIAIVGLEPYGVNHKLCLFVLPATLLICLGRRWPEGRIAGLQWIGRWPLTSYLIQYYVIFLIMFLLG